MRYSNQLHASKRKNILNDRKKNNLITSAWFLVIFALLAVVSNFSDLDIERLVIGFFVSLFRISAAYIIALIISVILALLIMSKEKVENILLPIFDVLQSFPSFALFPVLIVALQSTELIIISVLSITIVWPILFTIISGIKNRREDLEEAAIIFGATGMKKFLYFTLPEIAPAIVTGSIVGWGEGWEFIIGAELLVKTHVGIGNYLGVLGENQQNAILAFGILLLMVFLFVINKLLWLPLLNKATRYQ